MQVGLFARPDISFDGDFSRARRMELSNGAWLEHVSGWLQGHQRLFDALRGSIHWRSTERLMYERMVPVPRLLGRPPDDGPGHPMLPELALALSHRYGLPMTRISMALYRSGRDSVALHGDKMGAHRWSTVVAVLSLGGPRRFLMRPAAGGPSRSFSLGWGDLMVMGGTCQATWLHGIPKVAHAEPRMAVMFRPAQHPVVAKPARPAKDGVQPGVPPGITTPTHAGDPWAPTTTATCAPPTTSTPRPRER